VAGRVGAAAGLGQQRFPLLARQAAGVPVGAGVLAPVVEEADVVVRLFERLDLRFDEAVEFAEIVDEILRQGEVHGGYLSSSGCPRSARLAR
jgi:hypothetical protein